MTTANPKPKAAAKSKVTAKKTVKAVAVTEKTAPKRASTPASMLSIERRDGVAYWIVKIEQDVFPWSKLLAEKRAVWDGVRNYTARNNLRAMKLGDIALYYHSGEGKCVVGLTKVSREAFPDPTAAEGEEWSAVELVPFSALKKSVSLEQMRANTVLATLMLVRQPRLSVSSLSPAQFDEVLRLATETTDL